jgi:GIY-YIG catalytic domain-containing protein
VAADTDRRPRRQPLGEDDGVRESVRSAAFPTSPGVYVLYRAGEQRALYVGVAATQTIADRWRKQHLYPRAGGSALRRSLGLHLGLVATKLKISEGRYYPAEVESDITRFLESCDVELFPTATGDEADDLEVELRERLRPALNIGRGRRRRRLT